MIDVNITLTGSPKDSLILEYAFSAEDIAGELIGCGLDSANKILLTYGATIISWERNGNKEDVKIKALTDDEFAEARFQIEEYNSWLIGTSGAYDTHSLSPEGIEAMRKKYPCPVKFDVIARNLYHLDLSTFRTNLHRIFCTDEYKLQLWDWMHTARYAYLFAREQMPDFSALPETLRAKYRANYRAGLYNNKSVILIKG